MKMYVFQSKEYHRGNEMLEASINMPTVNHNSPHLLPFGHWLITHILLSTMVFHSAYVDPTILIFFWHLVNSFVCVGRMAKMFGDLSRMASLSGKLNCFERVKTNAVYSMGILMCSCEAETSAGEGDTLSPHASPAALTAPLLLLNSHYEHIMQCVSVMSSLASFSCFLETHHMVEDWWG